MIGKSSNKPKFYHCCIHVAHGADVYIVQEGSDRRIGLCISCSESNQVMRIEYDNPVVTFADNWEVVDG